jgi:hypothetical protein
MVHSNSTSQVGRQMEWLDFGKLFATIQFSEPSYDFDGDEVSLSHGTLGPTDWPPEYDHSAKATEGLARRIKATTLLGRKLGALEPKTCFEAKRMKGTPFLSHRTCK